LSHPERLGAYDAGMVKTLVGTPDPEEPRAGGAVWSLETAQFTTTTSSTASSVPVIITWTSSAGRWSGGH